MPAFEEYKEFTDKVRETLKAQRMQRFFFWFGVTASWLVFCVGSAFAIKYLIYSLSFVPKNIAFSVLDVLTVYAVIILVFWVRRLFPIE